MTQIGNESAVPENLNKLILIEHNGGEISPDFVVQSLRQDMVVLIQNITPERADKVMSDVAGRLGLSDSLELQAGFAEFGHRPRIGKYFMSVNQRADYQFIQPHSEGSSFVGMQLASFFCYENSTDGGETILMNVDGSSNVWQSLRELVSRGKIGPKPLASHELVRARGLYGLDLRTNVLQDDDQILEERRSEIPGLTIVKALAKPKEAYSCILGRGVYVYWDSVASIDFDSASEYARLLRQTGLLKEPNGGLELRRMDSQVSRRIWHSGVSYEHLFRYKITRKLVPGDFVLLNNLTWAHSANNWSPGSGTRKIAASFA